MERRTPLTSLVSVCICHSEGGGERDEEERGGEGKGLRVWMRNQREGMLVWLHARMAGSRLLIPH